jgi:hypothetical protein
VCHVGPIRAHAPDRACCAAPIVGDVGATSKEEQGIELDEPGLDIMRLFGASRLAIAVITFMARDAHPSEARAAIVMGLLVGNTIGLVAALYGTWSGSSNQLGWLNVVINLVLALGYAYFQFMQQ